MVTDQAYLMDTGSDLGGQQVECLERLLDQHSTAALTATGIRRGQRYLEIGAGSGSVARWMADRVRPDGHVTAVDIEDSRLDSGPAIDVLRHDINDGVPGGPYDVIHARLVLMHLARRREIVTELIDALAPGGWLVLGEFPIPSYDALAAPTRKDAELFHRVLEATMEQVGRPAGVSYTWAHEVDDFLVRAGMTNVVTERHQETAVGGETGSILYGNYIQQAAPKLLEAGITLEELERFAALVLDPRLRVWLVEFNSVRAQKPW